MNERAYSTFEAKSINEDTRTVTGIASTPTTDRMDDIVEPLGAQFKLPLPMLWQHDSRQPVGHVIAAKATKDGITVTCQFAKVDEPPSLKDDLDRAWAMVKAKLVRGFSIGFTAIEYSEIQGSWGRRFTKWDWHELSAVTIPANADCTIQTVKSHDDRLLLRQRGVVRLHSAPTGAKPKEDTPEARAATGQPRKGVVRLGDPPGASGLSKRQPA